MKIELTEVEKEICVCAGYGAHVSGGFLDANSYQAGIISHGIEDMIAVQETDQGDWLTAKQWRDAKSGLIDKLRKIILRGV